MNSLSALKFLKPISEQRLMEDFERVKKKTITMVNNLSVCPFIHPILFSALFPPLADLNLTSVSGAMNDIQTLSPLRQAYTSVCLSIWKWLIKTTLNNV